MLKEVLKSRSGAHKEGWVGAVDEDGEDERGRVGVGFPWQH